MPYIRRAVSNLFNILIIININSTEIIFHIELLNKKKKKIEEIEKVECIILNYL